MRAPAFALFQRPSGKAACLTSRISHLSLQPAQPAAHAKAPCTTHPQAYPAQPPRPRFRFRRAPLSPAASASAQLALPLGLFAPFALLNLRVRCWPSTRPLLLAATCDTEGNCEPRKHEQCRQWAAELAGGMDRLFRPPNIHDVLRAPTHRGYSVGTSAASTTSAAVEFAATADGDLWRYTSVAL